MSGQSSRGPSSPHRSSRPPLAKNIFSIDEISDYDASSDGSNPPRGDGRSLQRARRLSSSKRAHSMSAPTSQKTPARSFFHQSYHDTSDKPEDEQLSSQRVREQTAELASFALSDAASSTRSDSPPPRRRRARASSLSNPPSTLDDAPDSEHEDDDATPRASEALVWPESIDEVSEPVSPDDTADSRQAPLKASVLSRMLQPSPHQTGASEFLRDEELAAGGAAPRTFLTRSRSVRSGSRTNEQTPLLQKINSNASSNRLRLPSYDVEGQYMGATSKSDTRSWALTWPVEVTVSSLRKIMNPGAWDRKKVWTSVAVRPAGYLPAVILGILLNILDALSYGMILFPLGQPVFASLGPDGVSMFYVSCIISQVVFSSGGSIFKGGIGSEMIEVVPFFHKMAFTILTRVGADHPKRVLATTILSYSMSSILTGLVFFGMGACRLGALIGFFPRHILIGCIGGVGWFLVVTGIEVSARLPNNLEYNIATLKTLFAQDTVFLWLVPLFLAILLMLCQRWIKHPLFVPSYFLCIPAVFYFFLAVIPDLNLHDLRRLGWVFDMPSVDYPFYHFYSLYDFDNVDWRALGSTVPAMFALTFFGVLHVPINVPALGFSTGEDNVNVNRELIAHGLSNALSGFAGSIQNYLVYTNSLLFIRSGGDSRLAGLMLACGTFGVMAIGPTLIGYIPIMVVGALIFLLGLDLMREALFDTWGRLHKLEYLTLLAIVITMGAWDFVYGILVGIVLACLNFVVQTSRKSAIRATYSGQIAGSTVRRHPSQHRFLREVGPQIYVAKLAGYLFFGTIVSVEARVRALLDEDAFSLRPIRYLILDLSHVSGIDFSAAEAFKRINRILGAKNVAMVMCGVAQKSEIGESLRSVGLWDGDSDVHIFNELNSALEYCENELLTAFYSQRDALAQRDRHADHLDVPASSNIKPHQEPLTFNSPRSNLLQQAAQKTLTEYEATRPLKWGHFKQPLPLMLQTFHELTDKNEDFWFLACPFFVREEHLAGTILYKRGDRPNGFYLLQEGIFKAEYDLPQGKYFESIVAGTTCGELPFFSDTNRTATVSAERDSIAWLMTEDNWGEVQKKQPEVAHELLRISLKLTSERMQAITSYVLTTAG